MQSPAEAKAELGMLPNLMTEGTPHEKMVAAKEVNEALEADPTVTRSVLNAGVFYPLLVPSNQMIRRAT